MTYLYHIISKSYHRKPIYEEILLWMFIPRLKEGLTLLRKQTTAGNKDALRERLRAALLKSKFTADEIDTKHAAKRFATKIK